MSKRKKGCTFLSRRWHWRRADEGDCEGRTLGCGEVGAEPGSGGCTAKERGPVC